MTFNLESPAVAWMVQEVITPVMYILFCLLVVFVGLLLVFGIVYLVYRIVNGYYRIHTAWMTREYLNDLVDYAKGDTELEERRQRLLRVAKKSHLHDF